LAHIANTSFICKYPRLSDYILFYRKDVANIWQYLFLCDKNIMNMKRFYHSIALLLCVLMTSITSACSDDEDDATIIVSETSLSASCDGNNFTIDVTSNSNWSVASSVSWISVIPSYSSGNGQFTVSVSPNSGAERVGEISVFLNDSSAPTQTITITQEAVGEHEVKVSPMVVALEDGILEASVDVSDIPHGWTFEIVEGDTWMEVSKSDQQLNIVADPLYIPYRTGLVDIIALNQRYHVYVVQADFTQVAADNFQVGFYGQLHGMNYNTGLVYVVGEIYDSPYVGQQYQDYIYLQVNDKNIVDFLNYSLADGIYPFELSPKNDENYCSAGFTDEDMGVYGSCWLKRWFYMNEDYGFSYGSIFKEGALYVKHEKDNVWSLYIVGTGNDMIGNDEVYAMKINGTASYVDATQANSYSVKFQNNLFSRKTIVKH
jgi:hypothetical protein